MLKDGLEPEGEFVRSTDEISLTVAGINTETSGDGDGDGNEGDDDGGDNGNDGDTVYIVIGPYGAWKTLFTSLAGSTMTFEIEILQSPGSRGAQSITWSINEAVIGSCIFIFIQILRILSGPSVVLSSCQECVICWLRNRSYCNLPALTTKHKLNKVSKER